MVAVIDGRLIHHRDCIEKPLRFAEDTIELASAGNQRAVIGLAADNLTGTCGDVLTTQTPSGEAWLFSISISRMNFSASMGGASSRCRAITAPARSDPGAVCFACS